MSYTYGEKNGPLLSQTYGNGDVVSYTYDAYGRAKTTTFNDGRVLTYTYTGDGQLYAIFDSVTGFIYRYTYDNLGRVVASAMLDGTEVLMQTRQTYNANNQLTSQVFRIGDTAYTEYYTYDGRDGSLATYTTGNGHVLTLEYDTLRRLKGVNAPGLDRNYTYRDISELQTTSQISSLWYGDEQATAPYSYGYTYDTLGNIATYTENGTAYAYTYDPQGQLLTATVGDKTYTYTYDTVGNILTASDGTATHTYTYGDTVWQDKLTAFDGHSFAYDASGNPLSYNNGQSYAFTWQNGRELASATVGDSAVSYTYDLSGLRMSKTVNGVLHTYYYMGDRLVRETYGSNVLDFYYDQSGRPYCLNYNGTTYYYILNLQGDVLALVDGSGNEVAAYTYTPYGEVITATGTVAEANPLRYRGYYYDADTGFYYLQSRYYDPMLGRFLNADGYMSTGQGVQGNNMFAYCNNNPIFFKDSGGNRLEPSVAFSNDGNDGGGETPEPNYIDFSVEPYIRIAVGDYDDLVKKRGRDNAIASILDSIAHELTHYFQWINGITLTEVGYERQAKMYAKYIVYEYSETREHP